MDSDLSKIEKRKGIIVIGMISSGKSTFLNSLLGITYLESNDNITTKLVTIIRYNEELKEPKFYHVKVLPEENVEDGYYFIKDGEESIGEQGIIERISEINKKEAKESESKEPKYDNLFYILETNILNIENKEFLKGHDFYDIPGLNEYMRANDEGSTKEDIKQNTDNNEKTKEEENDKNKKNELTKESNEDMKYIKGIFQYLKKIIERKIIIFSAENYYKSQNLQIIQEIKNYLNIPLKDNLVILNKIDISNDREYTIADCKQFFVNNMDSSIFNVNNNIFAPLNSIQFQNEMLMKNDYKYYYLYFLNLYKEKYVSITEKDSKKIRKISFLEFLVNQITNGKKKDEKINYLEDLSNEFDDSKLELIKNIYEEGKKNSNMIIDYGINFDDEYDDSIMYLKAFYINYEKKLFFPEYSEDTKTILNFFNNFKNKSENLETAPLIEEITESPETKAIKILKNVFLKLKKYANKDDEDDIINTLNSNLDLMEKFILNDKKIYIPFIGISSAGKTTIINCIVGYKLFPEALNECTTRGIIIEYSDVIELYETEIDSNKNYYVFNEKNKVAEGYKEVREYLQSLNFKYGNSESKFFYKVKTTIKTFDDFGFNDELKQRILLIDLPGPDTTNNKFNEMVNNERTAYEKLLSISSSFIYINKGRAIKSKENQNILNNLYNRIQDTSNLSGLYYLKACFFVINIFGKLNENEMDLSLINEDLATILFDPKEKSYETLKKEIKSSIFNAKNFYDYLRYSNLLKDYKALLEIYKDDYMNQDESSIFNSDNFPKYCLQKLKSTLKDLGFTIANQSQCSEEYLNEINKIITNIMTNFLKKPIKPNDNKIIKDIANILYPFLNEEYIKENMTAYKNAYSLEFLNNLKKQIEYSKIYKDEDYLKKLKDILKYFDTFFKSNIKKPISTTYKELKKKKEELNKGLDKIFNDFNVENLFDKAEEEINVDIRKNNKLVRNFLKDNYEEEQILDIAKRDIKIHFDLLEKSINNEINTFNKKIEKYIKTIKEIANTQTEGLKNNEEYNNSINDLLISHNNFLETEEAQSSFLSYIASFFSRLKFLFSKKGDEKVIKQRIDQLRLEVINKIKNKKRIFKIKLKEQRIKIKANFKSIIGLTFSDLRNIEEKEWKSSKKSYKEAKELLLSEKKEKVEEGNELNLIDLKEEKEKEESPDKEESEKKKENNS